MTSRQDRVEAILRSSVLPTSQVKAYAAQIVDALEEKQCLTEITWKGKLFHCTRCSGHEGRHTVKST